MSTVDTVQAKVKTYLGCLDKHLSQHKCLNDLESRTGVPKTYFAFGAASIAFVMIVLNLAGQLLTNTISWVYPAYASFKAIESPGSTDDKQWLTYWTVIGFVQMLEYFSDILLYWFPFYYLFKTAFVLWLCLPQFRGAEVLYIRVLRPVLLNAQGEVDRRSDDLRHKVDDLLSEGSANKTD